MYIHIRVRQYNYNMEGIYRIDDPAQFYNKLVQFYKVRA